MDEEISLGDVFGRLWKRRGILLATLTLGVAAALATALLWLGSSTGGAVAYYIDLEGVEKGAYPGGAAFSPNDLQRREVLRAAWAAVAPRQGAGGIERIASALMVEHGTPATAGLIRKYRARIADKNLSPAEIDTINAEFKDELHILSLGSLKLAIDAEAAGLPPHTAQRLLEQIPVQWSRIYSERYRIFQDPDLESSALWEEVPKLDRPSAIIAANAALKTVRRGLSLMLQDNRVNYLVSPSGNSAAELMERLERFESIEFRPLSESVMTQRDPVADSYRAELRRRIRFLKAQITSYDRIAEDMGGLSDASSRPGGTDEGVPATNQLQLSGDSLRQIIGLAEQASSAVFLREVLLSRHELVKEIADVEAELARLEVPSEFAPPDSFAEKVEAKLDRLLGEYAALHDVARKALRSDLGRLYSASAGPFVTGRLKTRQVAVVAAGILAGFTFLGVLLALLLPAPQLEVKLSEPPVRSRVAGSA